MTAIDRDGCRPVANHLRDLHTDLLPQTCLDLVTGVECSMTIDTPCGGRQRHIRGTSKRTRPWRVAGDNIGIKVSILLSPKNKISYIMGPFVCYAMCVKFPEKNA